ncbi:MAG TPA: efflux RND transporter periplasmic adaptor subunit [Polyangiales bacterium]
MTTKPLIVTSLLLGLLGACGAEPAPKAVAPLPTARVSTVAVQASAHAQSEEVVGTVRAKTVSALSASVMGAIAELRVSVGSHVRAGDVVVRLTAGEIEAKAAQARARYSQAEVNLHRVEHLRATDAVASSTYDSMLAEFQVAQAALAEAEVMRGYTVLRAPITGVVTEKRADVGDLALPGRPLIVIENADSLRLEAAVAEATAATLRVGQVLSVRLDALDRLVEAKLSEVSPTSDPTSRSVVVKLDLPSDPALRAGMFGRLLLAGDKSSALSIPETALTRQGQLDTVFVVNNGVAKLRLVRTGHREAAAVEILAGLGEHELVVRDDPSRLRDGQPVETR